MGLDATVDSASLLLGGFPSSRGAGAVASFHLIYVLFKVMNLCLLNR